MQCVVKQDNSNPLVYSVEWATYNKYISCLIITLETKAGYTVSTRSASYVDHPDDGTYSSYIKIYCDFMDCTAKVILYPQSKKEFNMLDSNKGWRSVFNTDRWDIEIYYMKVGRSSKSIQNLFLREREEL
jgi:hypothetical protein